MTGSFIPNMEYTPDTQCQVKLQKTEPGTPIKCVHSPALKESAIQPVRSVHSQQADVKRRLRLLGGKGMQLTAARSGAV